MHAHTSDMNKKNIFARFQIICVIRFMFFYQFKVGKKALSHFFSRTLLFDSNHNDKGNWHLRMHFIGSCCDKE